MATTIEGKQDADGLRIAIVVSRFNNFITEKLLDGALDGFSSHGGVESNLTVVRVPGAFEIPIAVDRLAASGKFDALVCLGAVIRGDTPHFDYVAAEVSRGLAQVAIDAGIPVGFGVLTTNTVEQAVDRAGLKGGNKGFDVAMTAIEMANLMRRLRQPSA
jgi:6,7-dimethyl-8-ribityllumazine synthase